MALSLEELQNKRSKKIKAPKETPRPEKLKAAKRKQTPRPDIQFPWNPPGEPDMAHTIEAPAKTSGPARGPIVYFQELVKVNRRRRASGKGFCLLSPFKF
jgi:hypothetical protein